MAINRMTYKKTGTNAAAVVVSTPFETFYRVRWTDAEMSKYGSCNAIKIVNNSNVEVQVYWELGPNTGVRSEPISAKGAIVYDVGDNFNIPQGFDIGNNSAATEVAIGEIDWSAFWVKQVPER